MSTHFADVKNHSYESVGPKFQNSPIPQGEESVSNQDTLLFPRALKMIKIIILDNCYKTEFDSFI